jgi:hypothetical protein
MKRNFSGLIIILGAMLTLYSGLARSLEMIEEALESESLVIKLSNDLTGIARGKKCDRCEIEVVSITPDTKLLVNGVPTNLIEAQKKSGKPGTIFYDIKTRKVTRIEVYQ